MAAFFFSRGISKRPKVQGIEAGWRTRPPDSLSALSFDRSLYLARGENKENGQPLNSVGPAQVVPGTSRSAANGNRSLRPKATVTDHWSDSDESGSELFKPPGHTVLGLFATQKLSSRTIVRAGLLNLTDRTYRNWSDVRGLAPDDRVLRVLARTGKSVTISLNMNC